MVYYYGVVVAMVTYLYDTPCNIKCHEQDFFITLLLFLKIHGIA